MDENVNQGAGKTPPTNMSQPPSIFNDVIGPVMRGPSSSHSAAANRIGRLARQLLAEPLKEIIARYDPNGALVTTHRDQGTDLGLYSGLLGWPPEDERLPTYEAVLAEKGIVVDVRYESYDAPHPNFYRLELVGESGQREYLDAISTGGGMIELIAVDHVPLPAAGDLDLTIFWLDSEPGREEWADHPAAAAAESVAWHPGDGKGLLVFSSRHSLPDVNGLAERLGAVRVRTLGAVLPVLSRKGLSVPFETCEQMRATDLYLSGTLADLALTYESARAGETSGEVMARMKDLAVIMRAAVKTGLAGTSYEDRLLPSQSPGFTLAEEAGQLIAADVNNRIIRYVTAIMEVKSSMGVIVAAPTAGSCGAMPGAVLAVGDCIGASEDEIAKALLIAGLIGVFIARDATFAAEEGGCMAECGSGSSMAAAAMVHLAGGTNDQQLAAASMALQNNLGMICDPVANRVEAPCLGRNVMAATNALACANMALGGYDHLVSLDEVIVAMNSVAEAMPREHCCTALGGLSVTPTSKRLAGVLAKKACGSCGNRKDPADAVRFPIHQ